MTLVYIDSLVEVVLRFICGANMLSYLEHSAVDTETHAMQHFNGIYIITCIFLWQTVYGKCELKMCVIFNTSYIDLIGSCVFLKIKDFIWEEY